MTQYPNPNDLSIQSQSGDSTFENLYVFGKLNYPFENDDLKIRSIDVKEPSFFQKSVTLSGDLNLTGNAAIVGDVSLDELTARNVNITGITTTQGDLNVIGSLKDGNGAAGNAGTILSSTGSEVEWIAANTTSVNNSINVGVNVDSTNADQFISFFGASSGNQPNRVDSDFTYNPSTNLLKIDGTAGGIVPSGAIILWSGAADAIPTGYVLCDGNNSTPNLSGRFVVGYSASDNDYDVNDIGGAESVTLTLNQIPSHTHSYVGHTYPGSGPEQNQSGGPEDRTSFNVNKTSGSEGGGQSHENRPPYYALCYIMKT